MNNKDSVTAVTPRRQGWAGWLVVGLLAGLAVGALGARYWFQSEASRQFNGMKQHMQQALDTSHNELSGVRAHVDVLLGQLVVEESTRKGLEASLQETQNELGRVRDQLAFFDQLLPPGPKGAINIRALEVEQIGPTLQYRVLLTRNAQDAAPFKGHMQFVASGTQDGAQVKLTLVPVLSPDAASAGPDEAQVVAADTGEFSLNFDEFQRAGGLLGIPPGFTPKTVTVNVFEGNKLRASRSTSLPDKQAQ